MKKYLWLIILNILFIPHVCYAASYSVSAPSSVTEGNSVTFTLHLNNTAAWNVRLSGSGSTSGCSKSYADVTSNGNNTNKNLTVTCNTTGVGKVTFTVTGDITDQNGSNSNVSASKTVEVVKAREKESESRLNSLEIKNYKIDFKKDTYNYSIKVEPSVNSIEISAASISKYAKVSGTGTKEINDDINVYEVTSTSETGAKSVYKITVEVIDPNPITIKIDNKEYTIIKSSKVLTSPFNGEAATIKINDYDIPSFKTKTDLNIIGIKDDAGNILYAVKNDNEYLLYNENTSKELKLFIKEKSLKSYKKINVKINEVEYSGYKLNDRISIVYGLNLENGEEDFYQYDSKNNTFVIFNNTEKTSTKKSFNIFIFTTIILGLTTIGLSLILILKKKHA